MPWPQIGDDNQVIENIREDFMAFAHVVVQREGAGSIGLSWDDYRGSQHVRISLKDLIVTPRGVSKKFTYKEYLASDQLGDLMSVANMITKIVRKPDLYIDLNAEVSDEESFNKAEACKLIEEVLIDKPYDATNLVFIRAAAGCGKTQTMLKLTVDRAEKFYKGVLAKDEQWLYLYVDAQGKALANIDSVLAKCLDDLRARIGYKAVAALSRNDLLVPIIDGFDELIGSGGYADAFGSLSSFLSNLERSGSLIATGRSTFYDLHVLRNMAQRYEAGDSLDYKFRSIEIKPWDKENIKLYFREALSDDIASEAMQLVEATSGLNFKLLQKPFYTARVADAYKNGIRFRHAENILEQLMKGFLERESGKFINRQGKEILKVSGHERLLMLVAEEMWWTERRTVDLETLQEYSALVAEEVKIPAEDTEILRGKMSSYAFVEIDTAQDRQQWYKFEHDVYYDYFLLDALMKYLTIEVDQLKPFLSRSLLGESLVEHFANRISQASSDKISGMLKNIASVARVGRIGSQLNRNAGTLVMVLLHKRKDLPHGIELKNIEMNKGKIRNAYFQSWHFVNCRFDDVDIRDTIFEKVTFIDTLFDKVIVNTATTRFIETSISPQKEVASLWLDNQLVYDPSRISSALIQMGVERLAVPTIVYNERQKEAIDALETFLRRAQRRYYFDIQQKGDKDFKNLRKRAIWSDLERILRECKLLEDRKIKRGGPESFIQHLTQPVEIVREGENRNRIDLPDSVQCLWGRIVQL